MFLGLALLELAVLAFFLILLVIGTALDRRGQESTKWFFVLAGLAVLAFWFWPQYEFFGPAQDGQIVLWEVITTAVFWAPVVYFLGAGLVYSILEFVLEVRRSARKYTGLWNQYLNSSFDVPQLNGDGIASKRKSLNIREIFADSSNASNAGVIPTLIRNFIDSNQSSHGFVYLAPNETKTAPEPKINKIGLARSIGAWTFLWPAYALSLVLGDLLTEIFNWMADVLVNLSGRFVRRSFSDVFKF